MSWLVLFLSDGMHDDFGLVTVAFYAMLASAVMMLAKVIERQSNVGAVVLASLALALFGYSIVRLRWQLPDRFDYPFESFAPFAFILGMAGVVSMLTLRLLGWL